MTCINGNWDYVKQRLLRDDVEMGQKDSPASYLYKVEDIITLSELERGYNKPPNLRCMNYVWFDGCKIEKRVKATDWGAPRAALFAAMSPGTDIWGQGPELIGAGPNACELNEKITRSRRNQLRLSGCLLRCGYNRNLCGGDRRLAACLLGGRRRVRR